MCKVIRSILIKTIESYGLSAGSLYKLLFIGLLVPLFIFGLSCGVASFFGYSAVTFNGQQVYGLKGLIVGGMIGVLLPLIMAAFLWCLIAFGVWAWTRVRTINLTIKD